MLWQGTEQEEQWTEADDTHLRRLVPILISPGISEKRTPIIKILPSVSCKTKTTAWTLWSFSHENRLVFVIELILYQVRLLGLIKLLTIYIVPVPASSFLQFFQFQRPTVIFESRLIIWTIWPERVFYVKRHNIVLRWLWLWCG